MSNWRRRDELGHDLGSGRSGPDRNRVECDEITGRVCSVDGLECVSDGAQPALPATRPGGIIRRLSGIVSVGVVVMAIKPPKIRLLLEDWTPKSLNRIMHMNPRIVAGWKRRMGKELYYRAYAVGYRPARHEVYRNARWKITFAVSRKRDRGNFEKLINDALVYSGLVADDNDQDLYWQIFLNPKPGRPGVEVELW